MTFYYIITDTNDNSHKVYSITANSYQKANESFMKKFFPLLQNIETLDFKSLQNICNDFDYTIEVVKPEEIVCLD